MALCFHIYLSGRHTNNHLVNNLSRALVSQLVKKCCGTEIQKTSDFDVFKLFQDLFLSKDERGNIFLEGIQKDNLDKIRSDAGEKPTSWIATERALAAVYGTKYKIRLDHHILTDHGVFYLHALYYDLVFELTLSLTSGVVKGLDFTKLVYKLKNIQLEFEMDRNKNLTIEAINVLSSSKEFAFDDIQRFTIKPFDLEDDTLIMRKPPKALAKGNPPPVPWTATSPRWTWQWLARPTVSTTAEWNQWTSGSMPKSFLDKEWKAIRFKAAESDWWTCKMVCN